MRDRDGQEPLRLGREPVEVLVRDVHGAPVRDEAHRERRDPVEGLADVEGLREGLAHPGEQRRPLPGLPLLVEEPGPVEGLRALLGDRAHEGTLFGRGVPGVRETQGERAEESVTRQKRQRRHGERLGLQVGRQVGEVTRHVRRGAEDGLTGPHRLHDGKSAPGGKAAPAFQRVPVVPARAHHEQVLLSLGGHDGRAVRPGGAASLAQDDLADLLGRDGPPERAREDLKARRAGLAAAAGAKRANLLGDVLDGHDEPEHGARRTAYDAGVGAAVDVPVGLVAGHDVLIAPQGHAGLQGASVGLHQAGRDERDDLREGPARVLLGGQTGEAGEGVVDADEAQVGVVEGVGRRRVLEERVEERGVGPSGLQGAGVSRHTCMLDNPRALRPDLKVS